MPKNMGGKKNKKKADPEPAVDNDDYEVEELGADQLLAIMPTSFGKQEKKHDLTTSFARTKRTAGGLEKTADTKVTTTELAADDEDNESDSDDMIGPMPAEAENPEDEEADDDDLPVSHEIVLRDHTKVCNSTA